jgi:small-conductance mechanosensitive channel
MYSWGSSLILTILGAILVLVPGAYLLIRIFRPRDTYEHLKPNHDDRTDDPSRTVVFIILAALAAAIGFLVLGLGIFGLLSPRQLEDPAALLFRLLLA